MTKIIRWEDEPSTTNDIEKLRKEFRTRLYGDNMNKDKKAELIEEFHNFFSELAKADPSKITETEKDIIIEDNTVPKNCVLLTNDKGEQLMLKFNENLELIDSYLPNEYKDE